MTLLDPACWLVEANDGSGYKGVTFLDPATGEGSYDGFTVTPLVRANPAARLEPIPGGVATIVDLLWARQLRMRQTDDYQTGYHDALGDFANALERSLPSSTPGLDPKGGA